MKVFIAVNKTGADKFGQDALFGGWLECLQWAAARAAHNGSVYVIAKVRPGERNAPLVAEVNREGIRQLPGNRTLPRKVSRLLNGSGS